MVRAIDAQQSILQSNMAEKVQQIQQQNPDMQQRYFALHLSEQDRLLKEKVKKSDESDKVEIKEKDENQHKRKDKENAENKQEASSAEATGEDDGEGGLINIKV